MKQQYQLIIFQLSVKETAIVTVAAAKEWYGHPFNYYRKSLMRVEVS
jgi:hypothetical protein